MAEVSIEQLLDAVQALVGRIDKVEFTVGPPSPLVGAVGTMALTVGAEIWLYGPKTTDAVDPWGAGVLMSGVPGPAGVISAATISMLAPGVPPTVTLGGTPSDRTVAFAVPAAADGNDGVTPNVSAAVTMIAPGQPALVTRSGPDDAPLYAFQLPRAADGTPGQEVEMQGGATHLQWRYVGAADWINLFARTDFKGDPGAKGDAFAFDAKPADLAARAAYDAEAEGFTVLVMDTGLVFARVGATPGVWSDGFPFGQTQNAILEALSNLNATPGLLYQSAADTFEKRAIGVAADADIPDRLAADGRYRLQGDSVPLAEVSGAADALDEKAGAAATLVLLGNKEDKAAKGAANGYAGLGADSKVLAAQIDTSTVAEIWGAATGGKVVTAERLSEAMAPVALTVSGGNLAINGHNGINFSAAFTANTTIPNPTNKKPGRTSIVSIGLTGGPWTTSLGSDFKKYAASPAIPTASGSKFDLVLTFTATDVFYSVLVKP